MDDVREWRAFRRRVLDEDAPDFAAIPTAEKLDLMLKLVYAWYLTRGKDQPSITSRRYQQQVNDRTVEHAEFTIGGQTYSVEEDGRIFQVSPYFRLTSNWNIVYDD